MSDAEDKTPDPTTPPAPATLSEAQLAVLLDKVQNVLPKVVQAAINANKTSLASYQALRDAGSEGATASAKLLSEQEAARTELAKKTSDTVAPLQLAYATAEAQRSQLEKQMAAELNFIIATVGGDKNAIDPDATVPPVVPPVVPPTPPQPPAPVDPVVSPTVPPTAPPSPAGGPTISAAPPRKWIGPN